MDQLFHRDSKYPSIANIVIKELYEQKKIHISEDYLYEVLRIWMRRKYTIDGSLIMAVIIADHIDQLIKKDDQTCLTSEITDDN